MALNDPTDRSDELGIDPAKVCYAIIKAREFDVKVAPVEEDPGFNPTDEGGREILVAYADDPTYAELRAFTQSLNEDEQVRLVALAWLGRGEYGATDWPEVLAEAYAARNDRAADYLIGMPLLGDHLEEGLSLLGHSCEDYERDRL